jgi:hypothetical protein
MSREVVRFSPNMPVEVALQFPTGKTVEGQYGPQTMFSLEGNKVMYLDAAPARMVEALEPRVGEPFLIVKKLSGYRGERAGWDVYLRTERPEMSPLEKKLRDSIVKNEGRKAAASSQQAMPAASVPPAQGTGTYGPVAAPAPAVRSMPQPSHPNLKRQYADAFALFLVDAGRATLAAERALAGEGGSVRFDSRDLAAIATSIFIAADKAGFLAWDGGAQ